MELCAGVPANWMVLVVGAIVDWAFAEKVANAMKTTRQNKSAAQFPRASGLFCAKTTGAMGDLISAFPSRKPWLPGSFADIQRRHHPTARHGVLPEVPISLSSAGTRRSRSKELPERLTKHGRAATGSNNLLAFSK